MPARTILYHQVSDARLKELEAAERIAKLIPLVCADCVWLAQCGASWTVLHIAYGAVLPESVYGGGYMIRIPGTTRFLHAMAQPGTVDQIISLYRAGEDLVSLADALRFTHGVTWSINGAPRTPALCVIQDGTALCATHRVWREHR